MEMKIVKHGSHIPNNDIDGYMYNFNTSEGQNFNSHLHKCYEFIHIIRGRLLYTVEDCEYMLTDGDFIMTKPDELHSFSFPDPCVYQREFFHIYPGMLEKFPELKQLLDSRKNGYYNRIPRELVEKYGISDIFRGIESYCVDPVAETDFMVFTYALQLITVIGRIMRDETPEPQEVLPNVKANNIRSYIDKHYFEHITLDDIASAVYMSPSYACRIFKKQTGMNVKEYLNLRRITSAKNLILEGRKASNIYSDCGYSYYTTFYRAFMKFVGMTPDEFKHLHDRRI